VDSMRKNIAAAMTIIHFLIGELRTRRFSSLEEETELSFSSSVVIKSYGFVDRVTQVGGQVLTSFIIVERRLSK